MKHILTLLFFLSFSSAKADDFEIEAKSLAADLKASLMKNLSDKIAKDGPVEAVPFCHFNVKPIAKDAAKGRMSKFEFGRTSHKIRNVANAPQPWAIEYLKEFQGKKKGEVKKDFIIHRLADSKRIYMEPLYVEAKCLVCHGENINEKIKDKVDSIYPLDKARGFKLGEFRGFIWVKEK